MGFSMQGGHTANTSANAGDVINIGAKSVGGGFMMGDINTGDKTQAPSNTIGGSDSKSNFDLAIPSMGGQGGGSSGGGEGGNNMLG